MKKNVTICLKDYKIKIIENGKEGTIETKDLEDFKRVKTEIEHHQELYNITYLR